MQLNDIVETWLAVKATRSRNKKRDSLAALLRDLDEEALHRTVSWLIGELPQGKIGVGYAMAFGVAKQVSPADASGLAAVAVHNCFTAIAAEKGSGSKQRRVNHLTALLCAATADEQRFLLGLLTGELRQGALAGVMADGLAAAMDVPADVVRRAAMLSGSLPEVARVARRDGLAGLAAFRVTPFTPLQPMLAATCPDPSAAVEAMGAASFDRKLDGARIQVHRDGDKVVVYTRSLRTCTGAVPEVVELALSLPARRFILDGEVLCLDELGSPKPFQVTMRRFGRTKKDEAAALRAELPLTPRLFDILLVGETELIDAPLAERMAALDGLIPEANRVQRLVTADPEAAEAFYQDAIDAGHEGIMAKALDSVYAAGKRGSTWLKIKPNHTLDLVVLAVDWGSGRRKGWLSNLHLGARDPASGDFVMLGKTFKGMTDALLAWQTEALGALKTHETDWTVHVRPELVVEIAFNDIQQSPRYPGGMALRFARVKRYRADKTAEEADTIDTVRAIHEGRFKPG